jgi:PAT family beta-lactamase induction signal transducer AmpG
MNEGKSNLNLTDYPLIRLFTLCILYIAQGIPFGFVTITFAAYLVHLGEDELAVGSLIAMATLPWALKWVWGPMIDRWGASAMGRRRPWILLAQFGMVLTICAMSLVPNPETHLTLFGWLVFIHNVFNSLQDVSVDALAVDLLRESERGRVNGFMYGSKFIGTFLGGACLSWVVFEDGLTPAFILLISMLLIIMLVPLFLPERKGEKLFPWSKGTSTHTNSEQSKHNLAQLFGFLRRAFSLKSTILAGLVGLVMFIASGILSPISKVLYIQKLNWEPTDYTNIDGGYGVFLGLAGAIVGGILSDVFGPKRVATFGCIFLALSYASFGLASPESGIIPWFDWHDKNVVIGYILVDTWMASMISTSLFAMYMTVSWPKVAATQFTAYMAILNLSTTIGYKFSGVVSEAFTIPSIYIGAGILQFAVIVIFPFIDVHQARRILGHETGK